MGFAMSNKNILPLHTLMPLTKQLQTLPVEPGLSLQQAMGLIRCYIAPNTSRGVMVLHPLLDVLEERYELSATDLRSFYLGLNQHATNMQVKLTLNKPWEDKLHSNRLTTTFESSLQTMPVASMNEAVTMEDLPAMPAPLARITPPVPTQIPRHLLDRAPTSSAPVAVHNASGLPGQDRSAETPATQPTSRTDDPSASKFVQHMFKNLYETPLPLMSTTTPMPNK